MELMTVPKWTKRKQGRCIGCMYTTDPARGERHYICLLLHHIPGAMSFTDLKTSPDGSVQKTYKDGCIVLHAKTTVLLICNYINLW